MKRSKGLFIVLEGPDKSGKSTQARLLVAALRAQGREVLHTREPGGTSVAEGVRRVLLDPALAIAPLAELFLYEASRAQHTCEKIIPALKAGTIVVSERFTMSTDAYQGAARGLGLATTTALNKIATSGLKPDLTVLLDIPVKEFDTRDQGRALDRLERENAEFRLKVRKGYLKAAKADPRAVVLDGRLPADVLKSKILSLVVRKLPLIALLFLAACSSEPKDITESRAEFLAGKVMEGYCSEGMKDGKCTDYYSKGQVPPSDPRFKWAFKYLSEYTDPKRVMIVLVSGKGETSVMLSDLPAQTEGL